jgi:hypothetical protein
VFATKARRAAFEASHRFIVATRNTGHFLLAHVPVVDPFAANPA